MDPIVFTMLGVTSMIALIVAFVLCAKRQSFTIEHDYDPNYVSPSIAAKNAYRVRHVHQPSPIVAIENGRSKNRDDSAVKNGPGVKKSTPEVIVNNNSKVDIVKETPDSRLQRKDGSASTSRPPHPAKDSIKQLGGNDVKRVPSKRKAPIVPGASVAPQGTSAKPKSVTSPTVSVTTPTRSGTTPSKASTPQGQKVAAASNPQRQSKKTSAPMPHPSPVKASASTTKKESAGPKTSPTTSSVNDVSPVSDTSSLPRVSKTTSSPEKVRYVKKSSTLPGRSSKRPAPVAPGQAQAVILSAPKIEVNTVPSNEDTSKEGHVDSKQIVAPGPFPVENVTTGNDVSDAHRSSRHVLDRLPSLPKERPHDNELNVNHSDIPTIHNGSDSIDGPGDIIGKDSPEEDPYAVIKNRKMSEDNVEHLKNVEGGVEGSVTAASEGEDSPALEAGDIILEPTTPEVNAKDGSPTEATGKAEPPYAKVIKRNKRNRANVRVHFTTEHPEEITPKKPPTPGALVSLQAEADKKEVQFDDIMTIPEASSYD